MSELWLVGLSTFGFGIMVGIGICYGLACYIADGPENRELEEFQ